MMCPSATGALRAKKERGGKIEHEGARTIANVGLKAEGKSLKLLRFVNAKRRLKGELHYVS
jgi:hypothetical protein